MTDQETPRIKKSYKSIYMPLWFSLVLILGIMIGSRLLNNNSVQQNLNPHNTSSNQSKISNILQYITEDYVDTLDINTMSEKAIEGMLSALDPHSQYIPPEDFNEVNDPLTGNFEGIGVQFRIEQDTIAVVNTIAGGPSQRVGIHAGDRIVYVNDSLVAGIYINNNKVMHLLKGEKGSKVKLSIFRRSETKLIDFTITRDVIPTYSVDIAYMVSPTIGYLKLSKFSATTYEEFKTATSELKSKGMTSLLFDLRGNSGGYLQAAIQLADEFLSEDQLIVYTQGKNRPRKMAYSSRHGLLKNSRLIVLIDEFSASASEIIAGAIQDNDRGLIIGRRSFGKGLVQEQVNFNDGSGIRLTVARYYTPTGRCIQRPYTNGEEAYYRDLYSRFENGEMETADSIHFPDSLKYNTPGGKIVYGGGGIMPDVFIPVVRDSMLVYYNRLVNMGIIYEYAFNYTDKERENLTRIYSNFELFDHNFNVTDEMLLDIDALAKKDGITAKISEKRYSRMRLSNLLKAYIARNLFDNEGFYPIFLREDNTFNEAINIMNKPEPEYKSILAQGFFNKKR